jgi:SnoaL-like domain
VGIEENKAVVRRFTSEVLAGGNLDRLDELVAPDFQALDIGGGGIDGFKAAMTAARAVVSEFGDDIDELVAEGDVVVARCSYRLTLPDGSPAMARGFSFYRLAGGKIVEADSVTVPELLQILGPFLAPQS